MKVFQEVNLLKHRDAIGYYDEVDTSMVSAYTHWLLQGNKTEVFSVLQNFSEFMGEHPRDYAYAFESNTITELKTGKSTALKMKPLGVMKINDSLIFNMGRDEYSVLAEMASSAASLGVGELFTRLADYDTVLYGCLDSTGNIRISALHNKVPLFLVGNCVEQLDSGVYCLLLSGSPEGVSNMLLEIDFGNQFITCRADAAALGPHLEYKPLLAAWRLYPRTTATIQTPIDQIVKLYTPSKSSFAI